MSKNTKKSMGTLVTILVIVLLSLFIFGFFRNGDSISIGGNTIGMDSFGVFCVRYEDKVYSTENNRISLPDKGKAVFEVKNVSNYSFSVQPYSAKESNFYYLVDDSMQFFSNETELKDGFNIEKVDGTVTLNMDCDTVCSVIANVYGRDHVVEFVEEVRSADFVLKFTNDTKTISFVFNLDFDSFTGNHGIKILPDNIIL